MNYAKGVDVGECGEEGVHNRVFEERGHGMGMMDEEGGEVVGTEWEN